MTSKEKIILFGIALLCIILVTMGFLVNHNLFYVNAYSPVVEKHRADEARQKSDDAPSKQPRAAGFTEDDINKQHGNGYSTY
jgi:hypothetical protein